MSASIFISHATKDDAFVKDLRQALEGQGLQVWVDSRNLRGGNKLASAINKAIEQARQVIVVLSPNTVNSPWVRKEIQKALKVEKKRNDDGYRVIPLLLPGIEPSALALWFDEEPVAVPVKLATGSLSEALPQILAALGARLPDDIKPEHIVPPQPVEDLLLELSDPKIETLDGKRRATATATLVYDPANTAAPRIESKRFRFTAPLGPIEGEELRWYLERYYLWPTSVFKERAERIEAELPQWGQLLYTAALESKTAQATLTAWEQAANGAERRFSVLVDSDPLEGSSAEEQAQAREAASSLLTLPWELLHDGRSYLFQGSTQCVCVAACQIVAHKLSFPPSYQSACWWSVPDLKINTPVTSITASAPCRSLRPWNNWVSWSSSRCSHHRPSQSWNKRYSALSRLASRSTWYISTGTACTIASMGWGRCALKIPKTLANCKIERWS